ncbi:phage tail assembly protein [Burkholderia cepacia]|uniref:phage tail assembly protein n=1 Tax=Burkholderia cepacia TaxID=292 RepID=UPI000751AE8D|nr:phage tail assembly protein [Burkholderia cepacia]KVS58018.1 phage tail protein [Burkholderia cepacia]KWD57229.1 phage tail protein [Burkholderia cepacia]KWD83100.1 phage tail protein [Burkholderia cepacia]MCA7893146.1 phage tail assembly protein [Burkholderia cepacia]MCA7941590.1 phage tail assembly protein [Burkholderia cepacia]
MQKNQSASVTLDTPIQRGEQTISEVTLTKPLSGALRGVTLTDVLQLDVIALSKVIPRISNPTLTEQDVMRLDPADLVQLGTEVAGFLVPSSSKMDASRETSTT